jgi:prevent-host-death family protein
MIKVNVLEAKNRLSELLRAVQAGEEVIIANRGQPVARLVAAEPVKPEEHPRGSAQAILAALDRIVIPESSRRTQAEIDAYLAEERASWD